jgi:two-component system response regulator
MRNRILHVEDNEDDVLLTRLAFKKAGVDADLDAVMDGTQAIANLQKGGGAGAPQCVLLDLKMPRVSGLEVLEWIRQQPQLKRLPVVMLTSSLLPRDINRAYELGANSYLIKPSGLDALIELAKTIDHYWLHTNTPAPPG